MYGGISIATKENTLRSQPKTKEATCGWCDVHV